MRNIKVILVVVFSILLAVCLPACKGESEDGGNGASAPSSPTGVTAAGGSKQVTISWNAVSDAASYNIYWSTTSGVTRASGTKISGATSPYSHTGLTDGTPYYYAVTAVNSNGESSASSQVSATPVAAGTYSGGTIRIESDTQFTAANGVTTGSGTQASPYVIEGWTIDAASCDTGVWPYIKVGIAISNTSKYFVIKNVQVKNGNEGISLSYFSNGRVENCVVRDSYEGIGIGGCSNVAISGNTVENCTNGIANGINSSTGITISNNTISGCSESGIDFHYLRDSSAIGNTITNCGDGISADALQSGGCTISNNVIHGSKLTGIAIDGDCENNTISGNDVSNNDGDGIWNLGSRNTITYNTANGNKGAGIRLDYTGLTDITAGYNTVSNNTASSNSGNGVYIGSNCNHNTISNNTANSNVMNGIEVDGDYNTVSGNTAASNNALGKVDPEGHAWYYDIMVFTQPNTNNLGGNTYGTIYIK